MGCLGWFSCCLLLGLQRIGRLAGGEGLDLFGGKWRWWRKEFGDADNRVELVCRKVVGKSRYASVGVAG
jgi:hypothetical protein